jgi:hypothetical protein
MLTIAAGPDFNAQPGHEKDVDDDFGQALIDGGHAEEIDAAPIVEPIAGAGRASKRERATRGASETR